MGDGIKLSKGRKTLVLVVITIIYVITYIYYDFNILTRSNVILFNNIGVVCSHGFPPTMQEAAKLERAIVADDVNCIVSYSCR